MTQHVGGVAVPAPVLLNGLLVGSDCAALNKAHEALTASHNLGGSGLAERLVCHRQKDILKVDGGGVNGLFHATLVTMIDLVGAFCLVVNFLPLQRSTAKSLYMIVLTLPACSMGKDAHPPISSSLNVWAIDFFSMNYDELVNNQNCRAVYHTAQEIICHN